MSVRVAFVEAFGEANAAAVENAARGHMNGIHDNQGSDPFRWAIAICIGNECLGRYAEDHGITATPEELRAWVLEHGDLASHDGDVDYLALLAGAYDGWVKQ